METVLLNGLGKSRRVISGGVEYIVAPLTTIVPGVLNGSKGALYYPPSEISRNATEWDDTPITVYHPTDPLDGRHLSAKDEGVLERQGIGFLRNSKYKGKLVHEGWFNVERTRNVDKRVYEALIKNRPMELSTGLFTDNMPAQSGANYNGKPYDYIAANYKPDHLAVLPDQTGACSLNDGCGVLINETTAKRGVLTNANPEGINQYSKGAKAASLHVALAHGKKAHPLSKIRAKQAGWTNNANPEGGIITLRRKKVENMRKTIWQKLGEALGITDNAAPGLQQPRGQAGRFGQHGISQGSGAAHEGAIAGGAYGQVEAGDHDDDDDQEDDEDAEAAEKGMSVEELRKEKGVKNASQPVKPGDAPAKLVGKQKTKDGRDPKSLTDEDEDNYWGGSGDDHLDGAGTKTGTGGDTSGYSDKPRKASQTGTVEMGTRNGGPGSGPHPSVTKALHPSVAKHINNPGQAEEHGKNQWFNDSQARKDFKSDKSGRGHEKFGKAVRAEFESRQANNCSTTAERNMDYGQQEPHDVSRQAAGASVMSEHEPARDQAMAAMDSSKEGNSGEAAGSHINAAKEHEKQATSLRKKGKGMDAETHDNAAALHRKAASMHSAVMNKAVSTNERQTSVSNEGVTMTREQKIARLTANCKCDEDRQAFNQLSDEALTGLVANTSDEMGNPSEIETAGDYEEGSEDGYDDNPGKGIKPPKNVKGKKGVSTSNAASLARWEASMPADAQRIWNVAKQVEKRERLNLVRRLVSNVADDEQRKAVGNRLMGKSIDELQELAILIPPTYNQRQEQPEPLYFGGSGGPAVNATQTDNSKVSQEDDMLTPPTMNYAEIRDEQRNEQRRKVS